MFNRGDHMKQKTQKIVVYLMLFVMIASFVMSIIFI